MGWRRGWRERRQTFGRGLWRDGYAAGPRGATITPLLLVFMRRPARARVPSSRSRCRSDFARSRLVAAIQCGVCPSSQVLVSRFPPRPRGSADFGGEADVGLGVDGSSAVGRTCSVGARRPTRDRGLSAFGHAPLPGSGARLERLVIGRTAVASARVAASLTCRCGRKILRRGLGLGRRVDSASSWGPAGYPFPKAH